MSTNYLNSPIPDDTPNIGAIRRNCLTLFEQSTGWRFRVKGTGKPGVTDEIMAVDWHESLVIGRAGKYHVDLCEITGQSIDADQKSAAEMLDLLDNDPDLYFTVEND